ncbi:hypothetical protein Aoki45_09300 [Algoriphagus sp. oki45]|uniref:ATP-binding protein n=1 Tax=Algoriphagus sp. oki45 TaxID=3067294 RepID=UPI0027F387BE|nr:hypothetical protein Aoki45_09300 [Algoriphagus sp. oki45]
MQERGINSTFKKIIYESSEMVFLADDTYPYSIFYGNEAFENLIGEGLSDRSLVGLGLDITSYIFKEELVLTFEEKDYSFQLELPHETGSNYYLFYKGKEIKTHGLPSKKEAYQFFKTSLDLIALGKNDHLTFVNPSVITALGYQPEELLNTNLCPWIHPDDLSELQKLWKTLRQNPGNSFQTLRFKKKSGDYRWLECSIQMDPDLFFVIARDVTDIKAIQQDQEKQEELLSLDESGISAKWSYKALSGIESSKSLDDFANVLNLTSSEKENLILALEKEGGVVLSNPDQQEGKGKIKLGDKLLELRFFRSSFDREVIRGVIWDNSKLEKLKLDLALHQTLWQDSPEAIMLVNPEGNIISLNEEAKKLLGKENQAPSHLSDLNVFFEKGENWMDWIKLPFDGQFVNRFSTLWIDELGKQLTLEVATKPTEVGDQSYVLISFRNISEKIKLEKSLEESSDFLMNLTEQVPGGLYQLVLDGEGQMNFSFLSKGIHTVLGLSSQELGEFKDISKAITKVHPEDLPQVIMSSVASARKMEPWQCQFRVRTQPQSDSYRWVLGAARPQSLANGDMVWYGYLTDITKQKEFETKLDEARKAAEKANQIKSDFLSMISHELRTPLNAISGSVYSLFQENPSESQKNALNTINFAVDNLIIMINDLLDFQKIEAGKLSIESNPFHLKDLLEQVIKGLTFHARDSSNQLQLHLSDGLDIQVKGDKTRLSQVLNNLITNALKFTNEGKVDVNVDLVGTLRNKVRVYFEVKDTGIGIAPENQEKIFNDFDQVKPTFSTKYGGTGLGLSITRKLLTLMGGKIQLESEVGKGSRFYFELELEKAVEESINNLVPKSDSRSFDKLHLLMAEDNDVNALVLGKIIKKWGYTYDRAIHGLEAVEFAQKETYDCILMDIQMPEMDGFEATAKIKAFSTVPVIALTAAAKLEIMSKIEEIGFDGFVAKPIDAAELLKKIKEVILVSSQRA